MLQPPTLRGLKQSLLSPGEQADEGGGLLDELLQSHCFVWVRNTDDAFPFGTDPVGIAVRLNKTNHIFNGWGSVVHPRLLGLAELLKASRSKASDVIFKNPGLSVVGCVLLGLLQLEANLA